MDRDPDVTEKLLQSVETLNYDTSSNAEQRLRIKVYKRRWYILFVYCVFSCVQAAQWNTWSPIAHPAEVVYGWNDGQISLYNNYGCIVMVFCVMLFSWLIVEKGFRIAIVLNGFLAALAASIRCIPMNDAWFTILQLHIVEKGIRHPSGLRYRNRTDCSVWIGKHPHRTATGCLLRGLSINKFTSDFENHPFKFHPLYGDLNVAIHTELIIICHISAIINGLAVLAEGGPAMVSAIWFPSNERATATAIGSMANNWGMAMSFLIGPQMVDDIHPKNSNNNRSFWSNRKTVTYSISEYDPADIERAREQITNVLYLYSCLSIGVFLMILLYFPSKPKLPPCASAAATRINYKRGISELVRNGSFWQVAVPYAIVIGVYEDWSSLIDVNLKEFASQTDAGWMGFWCILGACFGCIIIARLNDLFQRRMKLFLLILQVMAAVLFLWFALMTQRIVAPNIVFFYISAIGGSLTIGGSIPLFWELCCESAYPSPEAVTSGVQMTLVNLVGTIFYLVFLIPNIGTAWMNWVLFAVLIPGFLLIANHIERYRRLDIDDANVN